MQQRSRCKLASTGVLQRGARQRRCALNPDVRAIPELLTATPLPCWGAAWLPRVKPMPLGFIPAGLGHLFIEASIALRRHAAVRSPPPPLQSAFYTFEFCRDAEAHEVHLGGASGDTRGWQVPALRVRSVKRLTVSAHIVWLAIRMTLLRIHTLQWPLAQTCFRIPHRAVDPTIADAQLKVAIVVHSDDHLEIHHLARSVGLTHSIKNIEVVGTPSRPSVAAHFGSITIRCIPLASAYIACCGLADVAMPVDAGEQCCRN